MAEAGEQSGENADETLVPKRKGTSAIWQYFGFKREDDLQAQVLCRTCRAVVATSRGNTTNLHHHLLHHHQELHEQFKASQSKAQKSSSSKVTLPSLQQQSIAQSFVSTTPYDKSSKRHTEMTEAITHYLAKDMMPINTVTRPRFVSLVNKLGQRYQVPSRNYFSDVAIPKLYEKHRTTVESELCQVEYFACSTDLWSSRTTEPFISLTVHFVDREFQLKARCLQTVFSRTTHWREHCVWFMWIFGQLASAGGETNLCDHWQWGKCREGTTTGSDCSVLATGCILLLVSVFAVREIIIRDWSITRTCSRAGCRLNITDLNLKKNSICNPLILKLYSSFPPLHGQPWKQAFWPHVK